MIEIFDNFIGNLVKKGLEYFGRYYSQYPGIVIDNNDHLNMGRVKVAVPEVTGDSPIGTWALPTFNFAGENYGSQIIPPQGTTVTVSFKYGSPKAPLYSLSYHTSKEKPNKLKGNKKFWFLSPEQLLILLNDEDKSITVTNENGDSLVIIKDQVNLVAKEVILGNSKSNISPLAKGDKVENTLEDITSYMSNVDADIITLAGILNTILTGSATTVITNATSRASTLIDINTSITKISSKVAKTE